MAIQVNQGLNLVHDSGRCRTYREIPLGLDEEWYVDQTDVRDGDHIYMPEMGRGYQWADWRMGRWAYNPVGTYGCSHCEYGDAILWNAYGMPNGKTRNFFNERPKGWGDMPNEGDIAWTGKQHLIYQSDKWITYDTVLQTHADEVAKLQKQLEWEREEKRRQVLDSLVIGDTKVTVMGDGRVVKEKVA